MQRPPVYPIPTEPEFSGKIARRQAAPASTTAEELARLQAERERLLEDIERLLRWKPFTPVA